MAKRVITKKMQKGPNLYCWAVFVDGVVRSDPSAGLTRAAAQRIVRQIRERIGQE